MAKNPGVKLLAEIQSRFPDVKKVVDAKKTSSITFSIDTKDCELGKAESPCHCPTARAIARHTGMYAMVRRWVTILIDPKRNVATRYLNSPRLAAAIAHFDKSAKKNSGSGKGGSFQPGVYSVMRPGPRQSLSRRPPAPTKSHGSHPHKGPQDPLRQTWGDPTPRFAPVMSRNAF